MRSRDVASWGLDQARLYIEKARASKAKVLHLGGLGLTELPVELWELVHLEELDFLARADPDSFYGSNSLAKVPQDIVRLKRLTKLVLPAGASDLTPVLQLESLTALSCQGSKLESLEPLQSLTQLLQLDFAGTGVGSLAPIRDFTNLQHLNCRGTPIDSLEPIRELSNLQHLNCSYSRIDSLEPIRNLSNLQHLACEGTHVDSLEPIRNLSNLQHLACGQSRIASLDPIRNLSNLRYLDFVGTHVDSLQSIRDLSNLQQLNCAHCPVDSLEPIRNLSNLQHLACYDTPVHSLEPIRNLSNLKFLPCMNTQVDSLEAIRNLTNLQHLACGSTNVDSLQPIRNLSNLQFLEFSNTNVDSLEPIRNLTNLRHVWFNSTPVADLAPILGLPHLKDLDASGCRFTELPSGLLFKESLEALGLHDVPGLAPTEVLSQYPHENCLERLRAHFRDLEAGAEEVREAKVIILGNGRVGKTQISRRLRGLPFDPGVPSTHGITVTSGPWSGSPNGELLNLWDFGGQDIYHGAHALFMGTRAVFIVVWHPDFEQRPEEEHGGLLFRNHSLAYWLEYVRTLAPPGSPIVVVQSRCDRPEREVRRLPVDDRFLDMPSLKPCWYSAATDRGRAALDEAIREGIHYLREQVGVAVIGAGRLRVLRQLETWRDEDEALPRDERRRRTLSLDEFWALCHQTGGISSPESLLEYLHNLGVVFYKQNLFHGHIILDQSWALDAIYAIFERQASFRQITGTRGRFTRPLLELLVWRDYEPEQQQLFISLMESADMCFRIRPEDAKLQVEPEYVAPDLLPAKEAVQAELTGRWDEGKERRLEYRYEFLHTGLPRALMCDVGARAASAGVYWKYGLWAYERTSGCRLMLEAEQAGERDGKIVVRIQGEDFGGLATWLRERFAEQNRMFGYPDLAPAVDEFGELRAAESSRAAEPPPQVAGRGPRDQIDQRRTPEFDKLPPARFTRSGPEIYISYAWGDASPEGRRREKVADDLCSALQQRNITIQSDKRVMSIGDRISTFMDRLAAGDFIILVISDKYLRSAYCMYELFRIYDNARRDPDRFLDRVLPLVLPDAQIGNMTARFEYARYWRAEKDKLTSEIGIDPSIIGGEAFKKYKAICDFALNVSDVLEHLVDQLRPNDIEQLTADRFADIINLLESRRG